MQTGSQVKFWRTRNISGASQQNGAAAFFEINVWKLSEDIKINQKKTHDKKRLRTTHPAQ